MGCKLRKWGFSTKTFVQLMLITVNAQLLYAFWDLRNSIPKGFPMAMGITDSQAGQLYAMQGLVILLGTLLLGWVGDRFSIRNIMLFTTVGVGGISLFITLRSPNLSMPVLLTLFFLMLLFSEVLFKPANFKAVQLSTTKDHQGTAFGIFEFGRGVLAFLVSLLWTFMLYMKTSPKAMMLTASVIIFATAILIFFAVPKTTDKEIAEETSETALEAIKGIFKIIKMPVVWLVGLNAFCIYGTFVAAGTYFARFLQAGYGTSAFVAAVFASLVIALRMLPLLSSFLVEKVFKSTSHFMRFFEIILTCILISIGILFFVNPATVTGFIAGQAPDNIVSPAIRTIIMVLMLMASACCFMIRGVYYAPIGESDLSKKNSSAAMSLAITIGYIPALIAPLILGGMIVPSIVNGKGEVVKEILTPTNIIAYVFFGLAALTLLSGLFSSLLIKIKNNNHKKIT